LMIPSRVLTGHGSPPWLPAATCRSCMPIANSRKRGA
jgi:hypothetical protein